MTVLFSSDLSGVASSP